MAFSVENYKGTPNNNLIKMMDYKGYSINTLSKASGISTKTIWLMMHGKGFPRIDTIMIICETLKCKVDEIYPIDYN